MGPVALVTTHRPAARETMHRRRLIHKVRTLWVEGVLEPSLHGAGRIELGLTYQPQAGGHPEAGMVQAAADTHYMLPPGTKLRDVFQPGQGALLILGAPGAGKTTLLLELARDLLACAEQDEQQPIPVVFNLASWTMHCRPLGEWLIDELNEHYGIPRQLGQAWVAADQVLPLLDGLDEVRQEHRVACVEAINALRHAHGQAGLVVCSRCTDYAVLETRLQLAATMLIRPLTSAQVDSYLAQADDQLAALRAALGSNAALQGVAETPLMLRIMMQVCRGVPVDSLQLSGTVSEQRRHLFAAHVERMVHRRAADPHYSQAHTLHWLCWLARGLSEQGQSIFLIERLQPDWLPTRAARRQYTLVDRLGWALGIGFIFALLNLFLLPLTDPWINPVHAALTSALAVSLIVGLFGGQSDTLARESPPTKQLLGNMLRGYLVVGLGMGLCTWLAIQLGLNPIVDNNEPHPIPWVFKAFTFTPIFWFLGGLAAGGVGGALAGVLTGGPSLRPRRIAVVERLRWSWSKARPAALGGFMIGAVSDGGLQIVMMLGLSAEPSGPLSDLQWKDLSLWWILLIVVVSWVGSGLLMYGIPYLLGFGLAGGLTGGEAEAKAQPNQGIWRTARSAVGSALLVGISFGVYAWGRRLIWSGSSELGVALLTGLNFGLIGGLALGGYACLSHLALRLVLWYTGSLPWHLVRFLDYYSERSFLRKVGGGYIFVHRELQEYLATLDTRQEMPLQKVRK